MVRHGDREGSDRRGQAFFSLDHYQKGGRAHTPKLCACKPYSSEATRPNVLNAPNPQG